MDSSPKRYRKRFISYDLVVAIRTCLCIGLATGLATGFLLSGVIARYATHHNPKSKVVLVPYGGMDTENSSPTMTSTLLQETVSENSGSDRPTAQEAAPSKIGVFHGDYSLPDIRFGQQGKDLRAGGLERQSSLGQSRLPPGHHETQPSETLKSNNAASPSKKRVTSKSSTDPDAALAVARLFSQVAITLAEDAILNGNPLPLLAHLARPDVKRTIINMADSENFGDFVLSAVQNPRVAALLNKVSYSKPLQQRVAALINAPQVRFIVNSLADKPQAKKALERAVCLQPRELQHSLERAVQRIVPLLRPPARRR